MVDVKNIVVVGFGDMGKGIAQVCLMARYNLTAVDIDDEIIKKGVEYIESGLNKLESKGKLQNGLSAEDILNNFSVNKNLEEAAKDADLVIEAVIEKMDIKQNVCKTAIENSPDHCIFASNTSSMSISEIAEGCDKPENVIGMHFFNPAPLMRLIEVVRGDKACDEAMETGMKVAESLPCLRGDRYVARVKKDRPGFIVNRVLAPNSIYRKNIIDKAYEEGIPWEQVDADFSSPNAPMTSLTLADYTGRDVAYHTQKYYAEKLSPDFEPGKVLSMQVEEGKLGKKTGQGFYDWSQGRPNPDLSKKAGLVDSRVSRAIAVNEGCRILEEGVVDSWKVIDEAIYAGMNFPGPMQYGTRHYEELVEILEEYAEKLDADYLKPCDLLKSGDFVDMK